MPVRTEADLPPQSKTLWLKALSAFQQQNHGYAIQLLQNVLAVSPDFLEGRKLLRRAEFEKTGGKRSIISTASLSVMKIRPQIKKDPLAAINAIEKLLESDPMNIDANLAMKDAALAAEMPELAQFTLESVVEANPKNTKLLHEIGRFYHDHQLSQKAVEIYDRILVINPSDLEANKLGKDASARASMSQGGWETASSYRDLIKDKDQAVSLEQQGRFTKSEEMIENQLFELGQRYEQEPENIDVIRRIAALYEQKEDLDSAITWFDYAVTITKGADPVYVRKASDLRAKQIETRIEALKSRFQELGEDHPESAGIKEELDSMLRTEAELKLAEARARVDRNPTDLALRLELGELLVVTGQHGDAIPQLQQARRNPSGRYRAMAALADCYIAKNMVDIACRTLEEAVAELKVMDETKKNILYQLGLVYEKLGKKVEAVDVFKQIYEVDYGYRDVAKRVETFYSSQGGDTSAEG